MSKSLKEIASEMDRLAQGEVLASNLLKWHRWPDGNVPPQGSLREVVRRHSPGEAAFIRFLSYNTYLTQAAHIVLPNPLPDVHLAAKPALDDRARELGVVLKSDYDVASLYEVMLDEQKNEILSAWGSSPPGFVFGGTLSSVFTISQSFRITRQALHTFNAKGKVAHITSIPEVLEFDVSLDSDFYANKGVLLTEIETPFGSLEIFSTHLMFGGGFGGTAETIANVVVPFGAHISASTPQERFSIELVQLEELISFYKAQHHSQNVSIVCGDFNIDGSDAEKFGQLRGRMGKISMRDAWADGPFGNTTNGGQTSRNDDGDDAAIERDFTHVCVPNAISPGDLFCDDTRATTSTSQNVGRFDFLFIADPQPEHTCNLDLARVRRRGFQRKTETEFQRFLSDHMGLETMLILSRKN